MAASSKFAPHLERLLAVAGSLKGRLVAIGGRREASSEAPTSRLGAPSTVHLLNAKGKAQAALEAEAAITALCFLAKDVLVGGTAAGNLEAWDAGSKEPQRRLREVVDHGPITALATDPKGERLAVVDEGGWLSLYALELDGDAVKLRAEGHRKLSGRPLRAVAIDPLSGLLVAAGDEGVIRALGAGQLGADALPPREMPCGEGGVTALLLPGDGRVVAGCGDGSLRVCYLEGAVDEHNRAGEAAHGGPVRGLAYGQRLADEVDRELPRRLFSIGEDGDLKAWQLDTKRKPRTVELSTPLWGLTLLPAGGKAKADKRGGTLVAIDRRRRLHWLAVNERAEPAEDALRLESELARLRQDARGGNEKVRKAALESLAKLDEEEARAELDRALAKDKKEGARLRAAELLGERPEAPGRRLSRPALRAALDDDDAKVRKAAFVALRAIESDTPVAPLAAALRSRQADLRLEAIAALPEQRGASPLVPGLVAGALRDGKEKVRKGALAALWRLEDDPRSLAPVRTALARGPEDIRAEALLRLGIARRATDAEGRGILEGAFDDDDAAVRSRALLVAIAARAHLASRLWVVDPHTGPALAELRKAARKLDKEATLADALEEGFDPLAEDLADEALQPLFAALASRNPDTALRGARCLALLPDPRATGALLALSREGEVEIRRYAVEALLAAALAMPEDDRLSARLEWLLDDADPTVRVWAFEALCKLAQAGGAPALLTVIELSLTTAHGDLRVRALAKLAPFGGTGVHAKREDLAQRADAVMSTALDDEEGKVRAEALRMLLAWNAKKLEPALRRAAGSRHKDTRLQVVKKLLEQQVGWADELLLELVHDGSAEVGGAAYRALTEHDEDAKAKVKKRCEKHRKNDALHLAGMSSPRPSVRALACAGAGRWAKAKPLMQRLRELVDDESPQVHIAAIEAADALMHEDQEAFVRAFNSRYQALQVRAGELLGKRRDARAAEPMKRLLSIRPDELQRPSDELRQRAARALADIGHQKSISFYVGLLDDDDGTVREMGARGLATACGPKEEQPLVDALAHDDLAVRSWAAEGLARLGDVRALPVLAGTLKHEHRPIRLGAILSYVALGPDGLRGILQGLEDPDREIQDLVFAIIVARDLALSRAQEAPDLLLSALSSAHPEIRFAAARCLELRGGEEGDEAISALAQELVGPTRPERAGDMSEWPAEDERPALLNTLIGAIASDHPLKRYAAARLLSLRPQPLAFWREVAALQGPRTADRAPFTSWEDDEERQPRKRDWIRRLFGGKGTPEAAASGTERALTVLRFAGDPQGRAVPALESAFGGAEVKRLAFGTYAGLSRQTPPAGESDETHRLRRDGIARLGELALDPAIGRDAVLPVFRRALSDPHHMVRKAALAALEGLYDDGALEPFGLALESTAADVGRGAVDALVDAALAGNAEAGALARGALAAGNDEVRAYALARLPKLYEEGSPEPWLLALAAQHADVRMAVVDRLADSRDPRVSSALERAMESDHEDLRLKAATVLARRGDRRTVDVLSGLLRAEASSIAGDALKALVALAHARPQEVEACAAAAAAAAEAVAQRLADDPDQNADRGALIDALGRIGSPAAGDVLLNIAARGRLAEGVEVDAGVRKRAFVAMQAIATRRDTPNSLRLPPAHPNQRTRDGRQRRRFDEALLLEWARELMESRDAELRAEVATLLGDVDDSGAEELLGKLVDDREQAVRVAAAEALTLRAEVLEGASIEALEATLRGGRRELVLPAAAGLVARRRPEAFQALLLVLKAGEGNERDRATLLLGSLGDKRALEDLEPLADPQAELEDEDRRLAPAAIEALGRMLPHLEGEDLERVRERVEGTLREGKGKLQERALVGLRHAGDDRSRSLIEAVAADRAEDDGLRRAACRELGELPRAASSVTCLAELLDDDNQGLRKQAMAALERLHSRTETALMALRSRHKDLADPAATFLAHRGDALTLVQRLGEVDDGELRRRLRQGLVRRKACPQAALEELLRGDAEGPWADAAWIVGAAREAALAEALGETTATAAQRWREAHREQIGVGRDISGKQKQRQRSAAWSAGLWALRQLNGGGKVLTLAREALGDDLAAPAGVRREALRVLETSGEGSDVTLLKPYLSDGHQEVRAAAAAAATRLAPNQAATLLGELTVADGAALMPMVEAALPQAEGLLTAPRTRPLILPTLIGRAELQTLAALAAAPGKDPTRLTAIAALGRAGGELATQTLEAILAKEDEESAVRAAAFRALRKLQRAAEAATRYTEDQDKDCGSYGFGGYYDDDDDDDWDDDDDDDWDDDDDEDDDE